MVQRSLPNPSFSFWQDLPHQEITPHWEESDTTRARLATYCLCDAYLPSRLLTRLQADVQHIEMANVARVPVNFLLAKGQSVKVQAQLYAAAREADPPYIMPYMPVERRDDAVAYEGAIVVEPKRGYYDEPIVTLDFASLYPSIMMAHNLCYSTHLADGPGGRPPTDYHQTPHGAYFVTPAVREGLLPRILKDLLGARKEAKRAMFAETDPFRRSVLDGRQLALKVSANSGRAPHTKQRWWRAEHPAHKKKRGVKVHPKHTSHRTKKFLSPARTRISTGRSTCSAQRKGVFIV